ncbi:MAG: glycerol-3-phosphate acyltransferase [Candidatus Omnitrophota bacterium]|nr:glycerol-3-phosphate acyltransferase [Candidatus Omnitrophota bacterium]
MMLWPKFFVIVCASYVLGSIPYGFIIAKLFKKIDIRTVGSGNVGAKNLARVLGRRWGIITFLMDALKGSVAVITAHLIMREYKYFQPSIYEMGLIVAGLFSVIGHNWTILLGFKGGKGLSTSIGVLLALSLFLPYLRVISFAGIGTFVIAFLVLKNHFISASLAIVIYFLLCFIYPLINIQYKIFIFLLSFILLVRHTDNFKDISKKYRAQALKNAE